MAIGLNSVDEVETNKIRLIRKQHSEVEEDRARKLRDS